MDFQICDVDYVVVLEGDFSMAVITPEVVFESERNQTLTAVVKIDNLEMIPSFRVSANAGSNRVAIKSFRIFNPLVRQLYDEEGVKMYEMELLLASGESSYTSHRKKIAITPECVC